jgi:hypothetical protein
MLDSSPTVTACRKGLVKQKLSDKSYSVEAGENFSRRNWEHMMPFQSKTAVFRSLGDGKESIESATTQRQENDIEPSEMLANLDEQPPAPLVERLQVETAKPKMETRKLRWLNDYME